MARVAIRAIALALMIAVSGPAAVAQSVVGTVPIRLVFPTEDCFGENVVATGTWRFVVTDGAHPVLVQIFLLDAIGVETGTRYVVVKSDARNQTAEGDVSTLTARFVLIQPGGARFVQHTTIHSTFVGDRLVVEFLRDRSRCLD
jgi:hypothetical protein